MTFPVTAIYFTIFFVFHFLSEFLFYWKASDSGIFAMYPLKFVVNWKFNWSYKYLKLNFVNDLSSFDIGFQARHYRTCSYYLLKGFFSLHFSLLLFTEALLIVTNFHRDVVYQFSPTYNPPTILLQLRWWKIFILTLLFVCVCLIT